VSPLFLLENRLKLYKYVIIFSESGWIVSNLIFCVAADVFETVLIMMYFTLENNGKPHIFPLWSKPKRREVSNLRGVLNSGRRVGPPRSQFKQRGFDRQSDPKSSLLLRIRPRAVVP
jgi:hypothetical protein